MFLCFFGREETVRQNLKGILDYPPGASLATSGFQEKFPVRRLAPGGIRFMFLPHVRPNAS
jgi:hypothetical protein